LEPIGIALAATAAKAVYSLWSSGTVTTEVPNNAIDLVASSLQQSKDQRAAKRQLAGLSETIFDHLEPILQHEFGDLSEGETLVVVEAVQAQLDFSVTDAGVVVRSGLDSDLLEKRLRHSREEIKALGLSDAGEQLYDLLLGECCAYITAIASQLPGFETHAARELLRQEASIMSLATETLEALPKSSVPDAWGQGDDHSRFATKYLRKVADVADRLELFGVTSPAARRPYELSVAYISLSIASSPTRDEPADSDDHDDSNTKANEYFDVNQKVLLLGDAGSGKTTLLRWLASLAARNNKSEAPSGASWRHKIPFIIPLRQFADAPLPTPGQYVALTAPNIAETAPPGWVHHVLQAGRGALLIDGLDEIPIERRDEVLDWIANLNRDFPGNSILVTSRGAAIENNAWKNQDLLTSASLQQMSPGDIQSFVLHWHEATQRVVTTDEREAVKRAGAGMLNVIRSRSNIRNLSQTPLLCALMCALHLENAASLPHDRMSLYRTALEMLVMKRDNDRQLARTDDQLNLSDRIILLKRMALWMHENGYAEISITDYRASIERTLPVLSRTGWTVDSAAQFLLERCGVLREPAPGTVDFIHRSFLEYLAAAAEMDDDSTAKLLLHATEEPWRDVIIMAAGHANNAQRESLLRGLLQRGKEEESHRHVLFLLAVACLQTAPSLTTDLRDELQAALNQVVPPTNMSEASAVASAGDSAAPLLRRANLKVMEAVASVRALSLIGTTEALEALRSYRKEHRVTVIRQLIRAWPSFDTEQFAREVLVDSAFIRGYYRTSEV